MRTVWILGAGASRAAYCGMPLVTDFMAEAFNRLRLPGEQGLRLQKFISEIYGYGELRDVNIEELLTFAWCDVSNLDSQGNTILQDPEKSSLLRSAMDARRKVEALIVAVLFQAQRECILRGDWVHGSLAEMIDRKDTVITYNYDLLIDDALWKVDKASSDDYGVAFNCSVDGSPGPVVREAYVPEPKTLVIEPGVPVLKLHGSLNWLALEHAKLLGCDPEVFYLPGAVNVPVGPDFWWTGFGHLRPVDGGNDISQSGRLRPMIVPPTFDKDALRRSPMEKLWPKAKVAIENSDRIVIFGLSLREADYQTRWLLRTSLVAGRPRKVEIDIVNPSPQDRDRLSRFFQGLGTVFPFESIDKFLASRAT
jgi:hypothetical protein